MSERKWYSGSPPHVGWWNASCGRSPFIWRWWNGLCWSGPALYNRTQCEVVEISKLIAYNQRSIKWTDYWPENARVPRIKP